MGNHLDIDDVRPNEAVPRSLPCRFDTFLYPQPCCFLYLGLRAFTLKPEPIHLPGTTILNAPAPISPRQLLPSLMSAQVHSGEFISLKHGERWMLNPSMSPVLE